MNIRHLTLTSIVTVSGTKRERVWSRPLWLQTVQVGSFPLYLALFILPTGLRLNLPSLCLSARWGEQAPVLGPRSLNLRVGPLLELTRKETEAREARGRGLPGRTGRGGLSWSRRSLGFSPLLRRDFGRNESNSGCVSLHGI